MSGDIREYLTERFRSDAITLRERANALKASSKPVVGPDATLSNAMADACEHVATLAEALPQHSSLPEMLAALNALLPVLNSHAEQPSLARTPAVRAVYVGAATRVHEVIAAEARAASAALDGDNVEDNTDDDDEDF
jgi:hypothetical protein